MKNMILMIMASITICLQAQNTKPQNAPQKKIAIYTTGDERGVNKAITTQFVDFVVEQGKYIVIERSEAFMQQVDKERQRHQTGSIDDSQVIRLGKEYGAQVVCVVDVDRAMNNYTISARLVNVATMQVLQSKSGYRDMDNIDLIDIKSLAKSIAQQLFQ